MGASYCVTLTEWAGGGCWECCFGLENLVVLSTVYLYLVLATSFLKTGVGGKQKLRGEIRTTCVRQLENQDSPSVKCLQVGSVHMTFRELSGSLASHGRNISF